VEKVVRFGKSKEVLEVNITPVQNLSYERFLQANTLPSKRENIGLEALFRETFPIKDYSETISLRYISYEIGRPRYTPEECKKLKLTYEAPLRVKLCLVQNKREEIVEDVYIGSMPIMVGRGEFIVNGVERIIVNQLHRSPGIDFEREKIGDKILYKCTIIPERGSWLDIDTTKKDMVTIKIDKGNKLPVTTFLRAMSPELSKNPDIIRTFYQTRKIDLSQGSENAIEDKYTVEDIIDPIKKEVLLASGKKIPPGFTKILLEKEIKQVEIVDEPSPDLAILNTFESDLSTSHEDAIMKIYERLRPGTPPNLDKAKATFRERFFDPLRYRLGPYGRLRINRKFGINIPETELTLRIDDIVNSIKYLMKLRKEEGNLDDIDHLANRRVRAIDELVGDELRRGLLRLKKNIYDQLNNAVLSNRRVTPREVTNSQPVSAAIKFCFSRGELSQIVDQTNPLSQLSHELRLSALGPGGLHRKRAGFEVRDVHISHYGRICPIETPEGANIGLITHLSIFSKIDKYGFITTPYLVVKDGKITGEVRYLRADEEQDKYIAPANFQKDKSGKVMARYNGEFLYVSPEKISFRDVSPFQMVSVSAGLIPFLEHDDANRALMGSNMERQAVPLIKTEAPIVSTGIEKAVAQNTPMTVKAISNGIVKKVNSEEIMIGNDTYKLKKFVGLTDKTCLNQKPLVKEGDKVSAGDIIADGASTSHGELALGKNILVAFMPWEGYNFEDAIVISQRLIKDDIFTSIHITGFEVEVRETKSGREEITRDIPNVPETALRNLDENGIITIGSYVKPGDILVGKVSPRSDKSEHTPEEKLLYAIFGKAGENVENQSLEVPGGVEGIVIGCERFSRKSGISRSEKIQINTETKKIEREFNQKIKEHLEKALDELKDILGRRPVPNTFDYGPRGKAKTLNDLKAKLGISDMDIKGKAQQEEVEVVLQNLFANVEDLENLKAKRIGELTHGAELPLGVLEMVRIYIATKRNLSVGDKLAGRHGNKGVIARILPEEDMPFLEDGTPVDMILNPLGVPSRMNVGQILETHLGWAAKKLGIRTIVPPFDGPEEKEIEDLLVKAGLPRDGKTILFDGRTGEPFKEKVTVGIMYMMKLHHLVDDKIHVRSTGPYSFITQQPLGGKARNGGQRFGEMEAWALEAYGASHSLREMFTVKSDDIDGRSRIYESIVKGNPLLEPGTPASFEVLINELKGLGLNIKFEKSKE